MNNEVIRNGNVIGYRCWQCGGIFQSMWGETCNGCRKQNELIDAAKKLAKILESKK